MSTLTIDSPRLSINEVADRCGVTPRTVWSWLSNGVEGRWLRSVRIGGRRYVLLEDLESFVIRANSDRA